jgi:hypothetical protein
MGDKSAVPALDKRVSDNAWINSVYDGERLADKLAALNAPKTLAADPVADALVATLQAKEGQVKTWAADQLGKLGGQDKKDLLPESRIGRIERDDDREQSNRDDV